MTNPNIQGSIAVAGRGHVLKDNQGYTAGEYNRLVNAEIDESGCLINRRHLRALGMTTDSRRITNPVKFIGYLGGNVLSTSDTKIIVHVPGRDNYSLWDLSNITGGYFYNVVKKFIRYNGVNYFITISDDGTNYKINLIHCPTESSVVDTVYGSTTFNTLKTFSNYTTTTVITKNHSVGELSFVDAFIHKDRLWIVCEDEAFFSKATDPLTFDVPDGGFFKFPYDNINAAIGNKDFVYIFLNGSIQVITYTTDPNVDAVVRGIAGSLGGDSCCVHEDGVYTVRDNNLYYVTGSSVTKVFDLKLGFFGSLSSEYTKIESFGSYIVFLRWVRKGYDFDLTGNSNEYALPAQTKAKSHPVGAGNYADGSSNTNFKYHVFFLNMNNGAVHALDFRDAIEASDSKKDQGLIADMLFLPFEDGYNNFHLFFMTKVPTSGSAYGRRGSVYSMVVAEHSSLYLAAFADEVVNDTTFDKTNILPEVDVEIRHYVPDGNEMLMKKFRSVVLQGKLPLHGLQLQCGFDNQPYQTAMDMVGPYNVTFLPDSDSTRNAVSPGRYPLNQRARALNLRITRKTGNNSQGFRDNWSIEDIKLLWGYTKRAPINRSQGRYLS